MSKVTDAVRNALNDRDMDTVRTNVKRLVCDELARADPTALIHQTEYFNHTYVPDVVLDWDDRKPREVFLRFLSTPHRLLADVDRIGASGPVIFDLSLAARLERQLDEIVSMSSAMQEASKRSPRLLITDSEATQHVRPNDAENMVERLIVANLLRSGRGNLDESAAKNIVSASRSGYDGAIAAEPDDVRAAVTVTQQIPDPDMWRRVGCTLQLLWWVGGGAPNEFPTSVLDDMELNPLDTKDFLREVLGNEDDTFWLRLAERLSYDTLVDVCDVAYSEYWHRPLILVKGRKDPSEAWLPDSPTTLPFAPLRFPLAKSVGNFHARAQADFLRFVNEQIATSHRVLSQPTRLSWFTPQDLTPHG